MDAKTLTEKAIEAQTPPTAYRLSKVLKVAPDTVYDWKHGRRMPTGKNLLRLLEIAGKIAAAVALTLAALLPTTQEAHAAITQAQSAHNAPVIWIMRIYA